MASGSYSPLQAYLDGTLKLEGDMTLGRLIIRKLGGSGTQDTVCPVLLTETYNAAAGGGTLTFNGEFFTPGGTVVIVYNYGGGEYQQIVTAGSSGSFTATEIGIYCGPILGSKCGVIVTATDLSTGTSTTQGYATPC